MLRAITILLVAMPLAAEGIGAELRIVVVDGDESETVAGAKVTITTASVPPKLLFAGDTDANGICVKDIDAAIGDIVVLAGWGTKKAQHRVKANGDHWPSEVKVRLRSKRLSTPSYRPSVAEPLQAREVFELRQQLFRTADGRLFYAPVWVKTLVFESSLPVYFQPSGDACGCAVPY